jgi:LmbE family N-acetylglucosaminyl deacetylase
MKNRVLLAVLAHPDDETFGVGGTLAHYASLGVEVYLICATRGEAGEVEEKYLVGYDSVQALRTKELECACNALGVKEIRYLGYKDSGMPGGIQSRNPDALINASEECLIQKIVEIIQELRPQVVITFDPLGGYGHPDHIFLHHATRKAFFMARDISPPVSNSMIYNPQKLYYNTISRSILRWVVRIMPLVGINPRKFGHNHDINLKAIVDMEIPIHARVNYFSSKNIRMEASNCHASQGGQQMNKGVAGLLRGWSASHEFYMKGYPEPKPGQIEDDLFEGVI